MSYLYAYLSKDGCKTTQVAKIEVYLALCIRTKEEVM